MFKFVLVLFIILTFKRSLCHDNFKIWGPGLKPDIVVIPARYFFIKLISNDSCSDVLLDVKVEGSTETRPSCHIWTNVLKRTDCSFIVRYKLYETCKNLVISIKYNDKDVAESPYKINTWIRPEDCNCPVNDLTMMSNKWECGKVPDQILNDLAPFEQVNFDILREKIIKMYDNPGAISLCHYVVKYNKIYRKCYGKYVGFKMFMDNILLSLSRKVHLPDLEFFINLGDWPLVKDAANKFPIFSWCGSTDSFDIVLPTYDITESTLENMGRVMLDMLSVQGNVKLTWKDKIPKVFWRGRDSNRERLHLIDIAREYPHLFNVSLTNFFFFRSEEDKYGPKSDHVSFFTFSDYKYQLNIDGTVAAYRLPYLLGGGSLLLKQESKYYEHFYSQLIPNVHYVPVKQDLSDLVEKIKWAQEHDRDIERIAQNGQKFAIKTLLPKEIFCYHAFLFREYSKRIVNKIDIHDDMEIVPDPSNDCGCDRRAKEEL